MVTAEEDCYFAPIGLFVEADGTVTWRIGSDIHSTTAYVPGNGPAEVRRIPEGAEAWNSGTLTEVGATSSHTSEDEGTDDYFCIPHKSLGMVGRVVVGEPGRSRREACRPTETCPRATRPSSGEPSPTPTSAAERRARAARSLRFVGLRRLEGCRPVGLLAQAEPRQPDADQDQGDDDDPTDDRGVESWHRGSHRAPARNT